MKKLAETPQNSKRQQIIDSLEMAFSDFDKICPALKDSAKFLLLLDEDDMPEQVDAYEFIEVAVNEFSIHKQTARIQFNAAKKLADAYLRSEDEKKIKPIEEITEHDLFSKAELFFDANCQFLGNLNARWNDEKEYEDFNEYIEVMKKRVELAGFKFVKMAKKPFAVHFQVASRIYIMKATLRNLSMNFTNV